MNRLSSLTMSCIFGTASVCALVYLVKTPLSDSNSAYPFGPSGSFRVVAVELGNEDGSTSKSHRAFFSAFRLDRQNKEFGSTSILFIEPVSYSPSALNTPAPPVVEVIAEVQGERIWAERFFFKRAEATAGYIAVSTAREEWLDKLIEKIDQNDPTLNIKARLLQNDHGEREQAATPFQK